MSETTTLTVIDAESTAITVVSGDGEDTITVIGGEEAPVTVIGTVPNGPPGADGVDGTDGVDGEGVPIGGTLGQVLTKQSGTDFDTDWEDPTGGSGAVDSVDGQTGVVVLSGVYQPLDSDLTAIAALSTTAFGRSLLALADAAAGRTAFGLGTVATHAHSEYDLAGAAAAAQAASQPLDSDLTAIAALTTTSYGRAFLGLADAAAGRTALGLGTAATSASSDFQPVDSDLTAIAALTTTAFGRGLLALADAAALRSAAGLGTAATTAATDYQPVDSDLTAIAALSTTSFGRGLLALADAAAARSAIGLTAATVPFVPNGSIAATDVQAAIQEVRDEAGSGSLTDAVILAPSDSARNVIQGTADATELTLTPFAGQTEPSAIINSDAAQNDIRLVRWPGGADMETIEVIGADGVKWYLTSLGSSTRFELFAGDGGGFPEAFLNLVVNGSTFARFDAYQDTTPANSFTTLTMKAQLGQVLPVIDVRDESDVPVQRVLPSGAIGTSSGEPADADMVQGEMFVYRVPTLGDPVAGLKFRDENDDYWIAEIPMTLVP